MRPGYFSLFAPLALAAAIALTGTQAFALATPAELEAKMGTTASSLLDTIIELKDNVGSMSSYESFQEYFALVPVFEARAQELNLDAIYPGAVASLADTLASHGMRWVRVSEASEAELIDLASVMGETSMARYLNDIENEIAYLPEGFDKDKVGLALKHLRDIVNSKFPDNKRLGTHLAELSSNLSEQVLIKKTDLDKEQFTFWLDGLRDDESIVNYVLHMYTEVLSASAEEMPELLSRAFMMGAHLQSQKTLSLSVLNVFGDFYVELIGKVIEAETSIEKNDLEMSLKEIRVNHLHGVVYRLLNPRTMPSSNYTEEYLELIFAVADALKNRGLNSTALELMRHSEKRMAASIAVQKNHEGTYEVTDSSGKKWIFTLVRSTEDTLVAGLGKEGGVVFLSFFNVIYSLETDRYTASEFVPNNDRYTNPVTEFWFSEEGELNLRLPFAGSGRQAYQGRKTQSYMDFFSSIEPDSPMIEGTYQGVVQLPSGESQMMTLTIFLFENYSIGRLENKNVQIELQIGTQGGEGFIYLNSGQSRANSWLHLRLRLQEDGSLRGMAIVGGKGSGSETVFTKVQ